MPRIPGRCGTSRGARPGDGCSRCGSRIAVARRSQRRRARGRHEVHSPPHVLHGPAALSGRGGESGIGRLRRATAVACPGGDARGGVHSTRSTRRRWETRSPSRVVRTRWVRGLFFAPWHLRTPRRRPTTHTQRWPLRAADCVFGVSRVVRSRCRSVREGRLLHVKPSSGTLWTGRLARVRCASLGSKATTGESSACSSARRGSVVAGVNRSLVHPTEAPAIPRCFT